MPLILLILAVPLVEIVLFIWVGSTIGAFATLLLVVLSACAGVTLLRFWGVKTGVVLQSAMAQGGSPGIAVAEGGLLMVAAILLIIPGFFSDAVALFLLPAPIRRFLVGRAIRSPIQPWQTSRPDSAVLEGNFEVVEQPSENPARTY